MNELVASNLYSLTAFQLLHCSLTTFIFTKYGYNRIKKTIKLTKNIMKLLIHKILFQLNTNHLVILPGS